MHHSSHTTNPFHLIQIRHLGEHYNIIGGNKAVISASDALRSNISGPVTALRTILHTVIELNQGMWQLYLKYPGNH